MDGALQLSGPLRPVPIYCSRPLAVELSRGPPLPYPSLLATQVAASKHKVINKPPPAQQASFLQSLSSQRCELFIKSGGGINSMNKAVDVHVLNKNSPMVTPLRPPDPRGLLLYQTLLRQHLLQTFLAPGLPPFFCQPAAPTCERSFGVCEGAMVSMRKDSSGNVPGGAPIGSPRAQPMHSPVDPRSAPPHARLQHPPDSTSKGSGAATAEDLVSSITAMPDPYQQFGYGRKIFPCPQCRYTTDRRNNLKRHMLTMHQVSGKLLECCGVLFQTKASLREHALVFHYHGYTCFYCGRRFCRKALLKRHLSVHNGMKEFICNVCDYATSHKSNLERHRRVHMRQDDVAYGPPLDGALDRVEESVEPESDDEISVCSHNDDEEEEINVQSD